MKSLLSFLFFVAFSAAVVTAIYFWKASSSDVVSESPLAVLDREFTTLVAHVLPSVVSINTVSADSANPRAQLLRRLLGGEPAAASTGSGVIVSAEGHIVTNLHVVAGAGAVDVQLGDGRSMRAMVVGADAPSDIAILKIDGQDLPALPFADSDKVQVGQMVFAVGNPLGLHETVTQGIVSAKGRRAQSEAANEFFQTDAAINPGNSGGPLISLKGEIIGINNSISLQGQGIGFAIPSNTVRHVFESIRDNGRFIRPWFGAYMRSLTPQLAQQLEVPGASGALVLLVYEGSPAEAAGLVRYDVIVEYNGRPIRDVIDLRNRVVETAIGEVANLRVLRDGKERTMAVTIAAEPVPSTAR